MQFVKKIWKCIMQKYMDPTILPVATGVAHLKAIKAYNSQLNPWSSTHREYRVCMVGDILES